jgi:hypothetical protein
MSDEFAHEALDCYKLAVSLSRWAARQVFRLVQGAAAHAGRVYLCDD